MSTKKSSIVSSAEHVFDSGGFGSSVDVLAQAAGVSTRTLYKHVGSKSRLVTAVLNERSERFFASFDVRTVRDLFDRLADWTTVEGARGCLFLRANGENGSSSPDCDAAVTLYRHRLHNLVDRIVTAEAGPIATTTLVEQVLILFEGATSAASYRGAQAITAARAAAETLIEHARTSAAPH